jgi:hypothetical protein
MPLYASSEDMTGDRKNGGLVVDDHDEDEVGGGEGKGDEDEEHRQGQGQGQGEGGKKRRRSTGEDAAALSLFCDTPKVRTHHNSNMYINILHSFFPLLTLR